MSATGPRVRELALREDGGLTVVLRWHPFENAVSLRVSDAKSGDRFEIAVESRHALDAFRHPFAYAPDFGQRDGSRPVAKPLHSRPAGRSSSVD
jgi:hypothetical protein